MVAPPDERIKPMPKRARENFSLYFPAGGTDDQSGKGSEWREQTGLGELPHA